MKGVLVDSNILIAGVPKIHLISHQIQLRINKEPSLRAKRGNPANQKAFVLGSIWIATSFCSSQ